MIIDLYNHKSRIHPDSVRELTKIVTDFKIKSPGYFFSPAFRSGKWDGKIKYVSEAGYFGTGLWPKVRKYLKDNGHTFKVHDYRQGIYFNKVPKKLADGTIPRDYQYESVVQTVKNKIGKKDFPRGVVNHATNAGKTIYASLLYKSYTKGVTCLFIVNRAHLYKQAIEEIPKLIGEPVGKIGPKSQREFKRFTIAMAQTLAANIDSLREELLNFDIVIVDECHYATSKTYTKILSKLVYAYIRIGMSGTPWKHKDKNKGEKIREYFGEELTQITNKELIDQGHSSKVVVRVNEGNTIIRISGDAVAETQQAIILSSERNGKVLRRVKHHVSKGRTPLLLVGKYHSHVEILYKKVCKKFPNLRVKYIHVGVSNRLKILDKFKKGKIDILVSSLLIKEGSNLPLMRVLIYAAAGDSMITLLQTLGRLLRKHASKSKVYFEDFFDTGKYILRHSKHRVKELENQGFKVHKHYGNQKEKKKSKD